MNKMVLGASIGAAAGITLGYLTRMAYDKGYFDRISDSMHELAFKAKKKFKDAVDSGQNGMEYLKDRAEYEMRKNKRRVAAMEG
jgi:hypothetical protein